MPYLPYHEPGITTILSLTSFILLLNGVRYVLDRLLYCGLIGEILIGIIWGLPVGGTAWLTRGMQGTIQAFGYLGLIGLVFEGGLNTDLALLRKTAYMSISVATIGLLMPIAMSFILLHFPFTSDAGTVYPTPLAAFSAGASLCSTSLGTTFAILSSANLQRSKVGVVLVGAAMMDDVVGLVMVNIVTTLGSGGSEPWPIARPIAASFGMLLITMLMCPYILKPVWSQTRAFFKPVAESPGYEISKTNLRTITTRILQRVSHLNFILSTTVLIIFVIISSFINASVLFSAFIAGGVVNYLWGAENQHEEPLREGPSGMYDKYFKSIMDSVLVPFFFASIGFSIPITNMFEGTIVWKGIVYALIMGIAKALVGIVIYFDSILSLLHLAFDRLQYQKKPPAQLQQVPVTTGTGLQKRESPHTIALLIGFAMIARGEIGFLIASLSQSSGTLTLQHEGTLQRLDEQLFLVIVWAVVICTVVGPLGVGIFVRKLREQGNNQESDYAAWL